MNPATPVLDWRTMPLDGRVLIEASAGTGKTWNIGVIYLRLLLERGLPVEQILVTTFTDAAAQELRERLRRRLIEVEHLLEAAPPDPASDDPLASYLATLCQNDEQTRLALRRIQLARTDLDRAPVSTIHALCQRIQRDYPLESGAAFASDRLFDEAQLQRECVEDFWRRRYLVGDVDPREAELLLKGGPEGLLHDLAGLTNNPDARIMSGGLVELKRQIAALSQPAAIAGLQGLVDNVALYKRSNAALRSRLSEIVPALQDGDEAQLAKSLTDVFDSEKLVSQVSTTHADELTAHPLIRALQALRPLLGLRDIFTRGAVLAEAAQFCREEVPRRARQRHVLTFSMLIDTVYQRLSCEGTGKALADRLFTAFPAALIDEFQDTDQRQFAIFDRIYRERGTMVMIGDPKQAIYSFRGGDIAAYLHASEQATHRFSLGTNHRSSRALVNSLNAWYAHTDGGFAQPRIRYQQVEPSGKVDNKPCTIDGETVTRPLVIHPFRDGAVDKHGNPLKALGDLESRALDDCANRIAEMLSDPRRHIDGKRLSPGDIAVLLSTNPQITALRTRLIARGVPCVGSGRGNIFAGELAAEVELLLFAVLHPDDDQAVRGALSTRLLGATLDQFKHWEDQPEAFERELERFEVWRALVRKRGVLALIEAVLSARATELLALPEGERMLTDLRHLGELLAEQESARQGLDGLYAWLLEMRLEGTDGDTEAADERQLRIESDARRVQLLTIHASKGREFQIVFLPLAWRIRSSDGNYAPTLLRYHDDAGQRCIDLGSIDFIAHRARHFHEDLQERLRLLYVGMTRAVHALHVYWVDRGLPPFDDANAWECAAIDLLIDQARQALALDRGEASLNALAHAIGGMQVSTPFADGFVSYQAPAEIPSPRATQAPLPRLRSFQWLHSFSGLSRYANAAAIADINDATDDIDSPAPAADATIEDARLLALYPLRGPRFGDAVHHVFELAAPGPLWPEQYPLLQRQLNAQAIHADNMSQDEALEQVGRMIDRARQADLGDGLRLADIAPDQRIVEFEFQFPVQHVSLATLRLLCNAHGCADVIPASLDTATLNGMLTGFADLILLWQDRYLVLDYKTNWLGPHLHDYRETSLDIAMAEHHYPLQALIYTVALHRYLHQRMDGYTAERHLGESRYLFVRALGLEPGLGVWRRHWPAQLIEALDDAFAGTREVAA
ncbi:MAG TPA: UvrD-helicase domain-containing protein [Rhodanobacter sp.]|nr:UvrD-helicase domain-containing protein [Rhodanobacter sp.]